MLRAGLSGGLEWPGLREADAGVDARDELLPAVVRSSVMSICGAICTPAMTL
jgi:hypothetical protein